MKKKIIKILLFVFILLGFNNVYAVPADYNSSDLPQDFSTAETNGYNYKIERFALKIYNVNIADDHSDENYINKSPDKVINLNSKNIVFKPEASETTINGIPSTLVDLNLAITPNNLKDLLSEEVSTTTSERGYLIELIVEYKLSQVKDNNQLLINVNTYRNKLSNSDKNTKEALNNTITQTLNIAALSYNNITKSVELSFTNNPIENEVMIPFVINYLMLKKDATSNNSSTADNILMFHSVENMDKIIEKLADDMENNNRDNRPGENVKIPNTAAETPKFIYILSFLMIIAGIYIITKTVTRND